MWPCYRLVVDLKVASRTEVETTLSIDDVDLLCIAADAVFDAQNSPGPSGPVSDKHAVNYTEEFEYDTDPPPAIVAGGAP